MTQTDNLFVGKEAREKLMAGVQKGVKAVAGTLGAAGYNAILEHTLYPFSVTTNDGVSLVKSIRLADPIENMGMNLLKEVANRSDKSSGDGTTTACVLIGAILEAAKDIDVAPMELKRSLEECIPIVEAALKDQAKEIDVSEVGKVATISAEDESIGNLIQEIYTAIGKDGIIFHDASRDYKDSYTLDKGVHISDCGFASPYMGDLNESGQFLTSLDVKNPLIVITKQKINTIKDLEAIGSIALSEGKKDVVIFADECEGQAMNDMVLTRVKGGFRTILFKLPILWKDWWIEDIAKMTGATIVDPANGILLKDFKRSMFGTCQAIIASGKTENSAGDCFLDGTQDMSTHIEELMATGKDDMHLRAARLNKKTARYHVGALTEQALKYRLDKVTDALGSAYQSLHGGIVAGGGVALLNATRHMPETVGGKILREALKVPISQILKNANLFNDEILTPMVGAKPTKGIDVKTGEVVDMFDAGIVDAYTTVLNSFKSAVSVAATILTAQVITLLPPEPPKDMFRPYDN